MHMAWAKDAGIQCLYLQSEDPLKKLTAATAHRKLVQLRHSPALGDDNHRRSTEGAAKGDWAVDRMTAPRRKLIVELRFVGLIDCPQRELSRVLCVFPCLSVDGITGMTRKKERVHPHTLPFPSPSHTPPITQNQSLSSSGWIFKGPGGGSLQPTDPHTNHPLLFSSPLLWAFWPGWLLV